MGCSLGGRTIAALTRVTWLEVRATAVPLAASSERFWSRSKLPNTAVVFAITSAKYIYIKKNISAAAAAYGNNLCRGSYLSPNAVTKNLGSRGKSPNVLCLPPKALSSPSWSASFVKMGWPIAIETKSGSTFEMPRRAKMRPVRATYLATQGQWLLAHSKPLKMRCHRRNVYMS